MSPTARRDRLRAVDIPGICAASGPRLARTSVRAKAQPEPNDIDDWRFVAGSNAGTEGIAWASCQAGSFWTIRRASAGRGPVPRVVLPPPRQCATTHFHSKSRPLGPQLRTTVSGFWRRSMCRASQAGKFSERLPADPQGRARRRQCRAIQEARVDPAFDGEVTPPLPAAVPAQSKSPGHRAKRAVSWRCPGRATSGRCGRGP